MDRVNEPYHSLSQILQHEREGAGCVCHGVGAMEDNEGIEGCIVELDLCRDANPI
jgi:hypothetical protein